MVVKDIETITKDPLKIFDYFNQKAWKDPNDPEIRALVAKYRAEINAEPLRSMQYDMVLGYMIMIKKFSEGPVKISHETVQEVCEVIKAIKEKSKGNYPTH